MVNVLLCRYLARSLKVIILIFSLIFTGRDYVEVRTAPMRYTSDPFYTARQIIAASTLRSHLLVLWRQIVPRYCTGCMHDGHGPAHLRDNTPGLSQRSGW
jgi:hypothetical protein